MKGHYLYRSEQDGFTLIEILIAMVVFAVGVLAVATMQIGSVKGNARARDYSEGTIIGMDRIEQLLTLPWNHPDIRDDNNNGKVGLINGMEEVPQEPDHDENVGRFRVFWNIADNQLAPETKTIALYVAWQEGDANRTVRMRNIIPQIH